MQLARGFGLVRSLLSQVKLARSRSLGRLQRISTIPCAFLLVELALHFVRDDLFCLEATITRWHIKHEGHASGLGTTLCCNLLAVLVLMLRTLNIAVQLHNRTHIVLNTLGLDMVGQVVRDGAVQQLPRLGLLADGLPHKPTQFFLLFVVLERAPQSTPRPVWVSVPEVDLCGPHLIVILAPLVAPQMPALPRRHARALPLRPAGAFSVVFGLRELFLWAQGLVHICCKHLVYIRLVTETKLSVCLGLGRVEEALHLGLLFDAVTHSFLATAHHI